jgi:NAD(P)-dependent dehydrogenase (short-subunit alcohol dehydrogenase family)
MKANGKVAIVSGAASGIGKAASIDLAKYGYIVAIGDMGKEG